MKVYLRGIGVAAPGLLGWDVCRDVLRGQAPCVAEPLPPFSPALLPANERRRATRTIKLALQVAQEALAQAQSDAANIASVFATSEGDIEIVDRISRALTLSDRPVSPTDFHNSVHNAPAGYFAIACGSRHPSTSLSGAESTVAAGLLEAATQVLAEGETVLLLCYDHPAPAPLGAACPIAAPFGAAFVLSPKGKGAIAELNLAWQDTAQETVLANAELEALRMGNPAARCLPLLAMLATAGGDVVLPLPEGAGLVLRVTSC